MVDPPDFESPVTTAYPAGANQGLTLSDLSEISKLIIRAGSETAAARWLAIAFGTSRLVGDVVLLGQRPDEYLVVGTPEGTSSLVNDLDRTDHVSIVDHTHGRAMFRLTGDRSPVVLEKVCSIDWSDPMMPDGAVVSASVAKVGCDIARLDNGGDRSYVIASDRSFGQYLFDAIIDAGNEFGISVVESSPLL